MIENTFRDPNYRESQRNGVKSLQISLDDNRYLNQKNDPINENKRSMEYKGKGAFKVNRFMMVRLSNAKSKSNQSISSRTKDKEMYTSS